MSSAVNANPAIVDSSEVHTSLEPFWPLMECVKSVLGKSPHRKAVGARSIRLRPLLFRSAALWSDSDQAATATGTSTGRPKHRPASLDGVRWQAAKTSLPPISEVKSGSPKTPRDSVYRVGRTGHEEHISAVSSARRVHFSRSPTSPMHRFSKASCSRMTSGSTRSPLLVAAEEGEAAGRRSPATGQIEIEQHALAVTGTYWIANIPMPASPSPSRNRTQQSSLLRSPHRGFEEHRFRRASPNALRHDVAQQCAKAKRDGTKGNDEGFVSDTGAQSDGDDGIEELHTGVADERSRLLSDY